MPRRPCLQCAVLTTNPSRCDTHQREYEAARGRQRGSATARGYGSAWQTLRKHMIAEHIAKHGNICPGYQREAHVAERFSLDHIVAKANGGTDERSNLRVLCVSCNSRKKDR